MVIYLGLVIGPRYTRGVFCLRVYLLDYYGYALLH